MSTYLYLSLAPEALVASMLPPQDFGTYLAVGTQRRTRGQAMFFEIQGLQSEHFPIEEASKRCVPHPDGEPKHSVYLSIYRVLERIPPARIHNLYLVTPDGRVLEIEKSSSLPDISQKYHLYQEICPVHPRIVSSLNPSDFARHITNEKALIHVPRICFVDLRLGEFADNPAGATVRDLPYSSIEHLRDCLLQLKDRPEKLTKVADRTHAQAFPYRSVETGIYLGDGEELVFYPFPSEEELQTTYYEWWRSASIMGDASGS